MLEKAVAAVSEDKVKALDMFNKGEGGFRDRDLYVFCANASDGTLTAHPTMKGEHLRAGVRQTRCSPSSIVWSTQFAVEMHTLRQLPE